MFQGQTVIKMCDIAYISLLQFILAIFMNIGLDKLFIPEREKLDKHTNVVQDFLYLCLMIATLVTLSYLIRHIVVKIPYIQHHCRLHESYPVRFVENFLLNIYDIPN